MLTALLQPFLQGTAFTATLLVSIGPQNTHVLRQGLQRRWVFTTAAVCVLCDVLLISLGAGGFGRLVAESPPWRQGAAWGGAAFLFLYAVKAFHSASRPGALKLGEGAGARGLGSAIALAAGFSLLNPHVYLDTVVLVGGLAGQYPDATRFGFAVGAMAGAGVWFFGLAYGASLLAPVFEKPAAWRVLDAGVGLLCLGMAVSLCLHAR